ncbi:DUF1302 family protein [Solimonas sp. K1W22B-7]|nr:DUF1302 family protein [Solimonas sp. K1W22B-7]
MSPRVTEVAPGCTSIRKALAMAFLIGLGCTGQAWAISFSIPWGEETIEGVSNTNITAGAQWRMEDRAHDLVGKSNLGPICGRGPDGRLYYQSCQGLFREQTFPAEHLVAQPGQFTSNADDGNLNYNRGDITQAPLKITQDLTLTYGDFGLFVKGLFFHDFINDDFTEYHPNRITRENLLQVGTVSKPGDELLGLPLALPVLTVRNDSIACPPERNPGGGPCGLVYGRGGVVKNKRSDQETLRQIGQDFQLLDAVFYGQTQLPWGQSLSFKLGRQGINWGESTLLFFDSINAVNPPNLNNFFRVGNALDEVFTPVGALFLQTQVAEGLSLEAFYQYEWEGLEAPAPGSFWSPIDVGTNNAIDFLTLGFGQTAEDPDRVAMLLDNPLSGTTHTTGQIQRLPDRKPPDGGQYGVALKYYAEEFNNGTEFGLYYMNYHSRLPYVSMISVPEGCAKHARNLQGFLLGCPDMPILHTLLVRPNDPQGASSDVTQFDNIRFFLDYPEDIQMFGLSFNTTVGDISLQGEVAYRPDNPLQVDVEDLGFMAYGPSATNCHLPDAGCSGSGQGNLLGLLPPELANLVPAAIGQLTNLGVHPDGSVSGYDSSDYVIDAQGTRGAFPDTLDLIIGHLAGSGRHFPSFIAPYRGYVVGTNPPESYIRGWEYFDTYQFNLGGTYVMDASTGLAAAIASDQIIVLGETGATWVPDLPPLDVLQLEAPGTFLHASAGADGSGADRSRQACSTNLACSYGPDGLRFNPHQQDLDAYPDKLSYGYAVAMLIKYESVLPGISLQPTIVWKHDVHGTSPGLVSNFIEGRKIADIGMEIRYKSQLSFNLGYTWLTGGGSSNLLRDRDSARAFVKYQF